ncbi:MAG: YmdB family metallophosphoesterase, partial [Phycisphaeraceae bacterium]
MAQPLAWFEASNLPAEASGKRWMRLRAASGGRNVYVLTLMGRLFMNLPVDHPFTVVDELLASLPEREAIVIVEVHAEATSEKQALAWYLSGRVAAVLGTHTHVPTADARLLPESIAGVGRVGAGVHGGGSEGGRGGSGGGGGARGGAGGTAYITDLGMCGPYDSVLGRRVDRVITHMSTAMPSPFDVAEGNPRVCGIYLQIDETSGLTVACEPFNIPADMNRPPFVTG